jgi:hypothetical protein
VGTLSDKISAGDTALASGVMACGMSKTKRDEMRGLSTTHPPQLIAGGTADQIYTNLALQSLSGNWGF